MSVITISSQFGAGGPAFGNMLAKKTGMNYLDKQIIHLVALDLKIDPKEVEVFDEAQFEGMRGFFSKVFDFNALRRGISEDLEAEQGYDDRDQVPFDYRVQGWIDVEIYKKMLVRVITAAAERGNAIIKGRGSQYILNDFPNAVHIRFIADEDDRVSATMQRIVPSASTTLPSAALGQRGGGSIATDPADGSGLTALSSLFQAEIGLPASLPGIGVGQRVHVRFDHGTRPIAQQWYRSLRQLFLRHFDV